MKQHFDLRVDMNAETTEDTDAPRIMFMGTSDYGGAILSALLLKNYNVIGVVTQPDRKSGRKNTKKERLSTYNAVTDLARTKGIPLHQPEKIDQEFIAFFKEQNPNLVIVASYGRILPKALLESVPERFINVHGSLLPKLRGASPIQNAILLGLTETGTTIMRMDDGMDTGDIIAQEPHPIDPIDTSGTLFPKLAEHASQLLIKTLPAWLSGKIAAQKQNSAEATLCQIIERQDGHIQWTDAAAEIFNRYRALMPWPGVFSYWNKADADLVRVKFFDMHVIDPAPPTDDYVPGEVFMHDDRVCITTGDGAVTVTTIQQEGKRAITALDFCNGNAEFIGARLQ